MTAYARIVTEPGITRVDDVAREFLRTSPLTRTHGWGMVFDQAGRVALVARDAPEYADYLTSGRHKVLKAMRSKRV